MEKLQLREAKSVFQGPLLFPSNTLPSIALLVYVLSFMWDYKSSKPRNIFFNFFVINILKNRCIIYYMDGLVLSLGILNTSLSPIINSPLFSFITIPTIVGDTVLNCVYQAFLFLRFHAPFQFFSGLSPH